MVDINFEISLEYVGKLNQPTLDCLKLSKSYKIRLGSIFSLEF